MTKFRVRPAGEHDIPALTSQRHRMFLDMHSPPLKDLAIHDKAFPRWARTEIKSRRLFCFLVETDDGRTVGGATLWLREVQPYPGFAGGKIPYLMSVYTEPEFRGKGVATMVTKHAMDLARERVSLNEPSCQSQREETLRISRLEARERNGLRVQNRCRSLGDRPHAVPAESPGLS